MILAITQADVLHMLGWGGLALLALVLLFALGVVLGLISLTAGWARRQFVLADAALTPLGRTPVGSLLHDAVTGLESKVDQTSDPYVQMVHGALQSMISGVVQAVVPQYIERAKAVVTPEDVQRFLLYMVTGAAELLDGEPVGDDGGVLPDGAPEAQMS